MKPRIILLAVLFMSSTLVSAQTIMNIHQSDGTVLQIPINTIDSITYTIPNPGNLATLTTTSASNVTTASATLGGNITANGGSTVTQRGICYSTTTNPTTANSTTNDGSGTGSFVSNLAGLTASTTYYVRAYATNSAGTAYGNQVSFTTTTGGVGGGTYPTGSVFCASGATAIIDVTNPTTGKIWMDRNLGATQAATSSADVDAYGDLYQWGRFSDGHQCRTSATTSTISSTDQPGHGDFILEPFSPYDWLSPQDDNLWQGVNGTNNPCPSGYRIPTEAELEAERYSWSSDDAIGAFASPLKLPFSLSRSNSSGYVVGYSGDIWCSTIFSIPYSRSLSFGNGNGNVGIYNVERAYGNSVRCIKDSIANPGNWATLTTTSASNVTTASATLGGYITANGGSTVTQRGICYSTNSNPTTANSTTNDGSGTGSFSSNLAGLTASTIYYVRAYATNSAGTAYGNQVSFQTTAAGGGGGGTYSTGSVYCNQTVTVYPNNTINGTLITVAGTPTLIVDVTNPTTGKIWMDRNLGAPQAAASGDLYQWGRFSDGHQCRTSASTSVLSSTDQPAHGDLIGSPNPPYDWRSPQNDNLWQGVNGVNNPCPSGYRIPTEAELEAERLSWCSNDAAGAFASPLKLPISSSTYPIGNYWSSTVSGADSRRLDFFPSDAYMDGGNRAGGNSVRCIKDSIPNPGNWATLTTTSASNVTTASATLGGNITANGGSTVTQRGICYSTNCNPTTANSTTNDGSGTGSFVSNLAGLTASTTYYARAYATNSAGTAYGNEVSFTTTAGGGGGLAIGDTYQGGIIFWLDGLGGGLIAAPTDQSGGAEWGCYGTAIIGADGLAVGTGYQNTIDIEAGCTTSGTAADICANLTLDGYSDWFLPSLDELNLMYQNLHLQQLGGFAFNYYWSSTEGGNGIAWRQYFLDGIQDYFFKYDTYYVRAIRAF